MTGASGDWPGEQAGQFFGALVAVEAAATAQRYDASCTAVCAVVDDEASWRGQGGHCHNWRYVCIDVALRRELRAVVERVRMRGGPSNAVLNKGREIDWTPRSLAR